MVNRPRLTQVATSDDEDVPLRPQRTRKRMRLLEEDNDDDNEEQEKEEVPEPPQPAEDAKPIGEPVRVSGKGRGRKRHYDSFEFDGIQYTLVSSFFSSILQLLGFYDHSIVPIVFYLVCAGGPCSSRTRGERPKAICSNY